MGMRRYRAEEIIGKLREEKVLVDRWQRHRMDF